jgi:hypothetical protein
MDLGLDGIAFEALRAQRRSVTYGTEDVLARGVVTQRYVEVVP